MRIETFNQLLQVKHPQAVARIPYPVKNGYETRKHTVALVYKPGGKVYEYRSTIAALAARLDLISNDSIETIAARVVSMLTTSASTVDQMGASDTIRALGLNVSTRNASKDEYGRYVVEYYKIEHDEWLS
jgi:hypothetical protein